MAKRLPSGRMRHRVTIKQHKIEAGSTAYDSYGQVSASTTAWTTVATCRAAIEVLSGDEAVLARQIYANARYRVTVDYNTAIATTGGSRRALAHGTRMLYIGGVVNPDEENVQLQLLCGEEK